MSAIELLQQAGLNKYEAEAYYSLLVEGPLTGYELGKRSRVPLSRSYEILERLLQKGLVLQQPGEPPRYAAREHGEFLDRVRQSFAHTVDGLAAIFATLPQHDVAEEFWVVRGRRPILDHMRAMIAAGRQSLHLSLPAVYEASLADVLAATPTTGHRLFQAPARDPNLTMPDAILALIDGREALAGTLSPAERCQAVTGRNPALIGLLESHFASVQPAEPDAHSGVMTPEQDAARDWVDWEARKHRRLWNISTRTRSA